MFFRDSLNLSKISASDSPDDTAKLKKTTRRKKKKGELMMLLLLSCVNAMVDDGGGARTSVCAPCRGTPKIEKCLFERRE